MNLLSKLTLIVPTYNRQDYVLRNMRYWSGRGPTLHILDGSVTPISTSDLSGLNENIHYHYLPISVFQRLGHSLDLVKTKYCMLMGDDDLFIPSGLEACIKQLESVEDLVSCMGRCLSFLPGSNEVKGWVDSTEMKGYSILQEDPIERMVFHMNPYTCSTIYSVVQTPVWKLAMTSWTKKRFQVLNLDELQFELGVCYLGKSKVNEDLMLLRSHENPPWRKSEPPLPSALEWWDNPSRECEHNEFLQIMADTLANGDSNKTKSIYNGVREAVVAYTYQFRKNSFEKNHVDSFKKIMNSLIVRWLPKTVKKFLKNIMASVRPVTPVEQKSIIEAARNLSDTGVSVDFRELKNIEKMIKEFHRTSTNK